MRFSDIDIGGGPPTITTPESIFGTHRLPPGQPGSVRNMTAEERNSYLGHLGMMAVQVHDPRHLRQIVDALRTARWRDQDNARRLAWLIGIVATCVGLIVGYGAALLSR